jgi:RNA ligase
MGIWAFPEDIMDGKHRLRNRYNNMGGYCGYDDYEYTGRPTGYYNQGTYTSPFSSCDKSMPRVDEVDEKVKEKFAGYGVIVLEKLKGLPVRILCDEKETRYENRYTEIRSDFETCGARKDLKKYEKAVKEIQKEIGVPIAVFGEYIGNDVNSEILYRKDEKEKVVYFFDLVLNDNWMNWDDFSFFAKKYGLPIVPVLEKITFDEERLKKILERKSTISEFSDQPMEGIIIRPIIEDSDYSRRLIAKLTTEKFKEKKFVYTSSNYNPPSTTSEVKKSDNTPNVPSVVAPVTTTSPIVIPTPEETRSLLKSSTELFANIQADKILNTFINDARIMFWRHELQSCNVEIKDENSVKIISFLTLNSVKELGAEIDSISKMHNLTEELLKKEIKRELPKRILRILGIKIPTKGD